MPRAFQIPNLQISAVAKLKNILSSKVVQFFAVALTFWALIWLVTVEFIGLVTPQFASSQLENWLDSSPWFKTWWTGTIKNYTADRAWFYMFPDQLAWGYADKHSILPGESFNIMLSSGPQTQPLKGLLRIYRITGESNKRVNTLIYESGPVSFGPQELRPELSVVGAAWTYHVTIKPTQDWKTGFYMINFVNSDGHVDEHVATMIVRDPVKRGDILVKFSTNTVQAYNIWGGYSFYKSATFGNQSSMISFDRPTDLNLVHDAMFFLPWVETYAKARKLKVDYIADYDLHADPSILDGYKLFVSQGHDEYWSKEMFDAVEKRIFSQGHNVLFLGANTAYWQVRYVDINQAPNGEFRGRQMICYKTYSDELIDPMAVHVDQPKSVAPWLTGMFRTASRRPETMLLGVAYQGWFPFKSPAYDYTVTNTELPFFQGTGLRVGDVLKGVVGYEWDNRDPKEDGDRLWMDGKSANAKIPLDSIHVLMESHPVSAEGKPGKAEAVYWQSPAGAKVFSSGTIWWSWGLSKPGVETAQFSKFNENLFDYMLK